MVYLICFWDQLHLLFVPNKENGHLDSPNFIGCEPQLDFIVPLGKRNFF